MRTPVALCCLGLGAALLWARAHPADLSVRADLHRSPIDLALLPGGKRALTANHTSDSLSLVDLERGKVLAEVRSGRRPAAVACSPDGRRAAASNLWSGSVSLFTLDGDRVKPAGEVEVGAFPRGLVFAGNDTIYAAVSGRDEVVAINWKKHGVMRRWAAPREPRHLALSAKGEYLAAASSRSADVRLWDAHTGKLVWERKIEDAFNLRGLAFTPEGGAVVAVHSVRRSFPVSQENIAKGWVIDSRLTRLPLPADEEPPLEQVALDKHGRAVGDPYGLAFDSAGARLVLSASGTQELLLLPPAAIPWTGADPGDLLDPRLEQKMSRLPLGGRPMGLASLPGGRAAVANYLLDAVQVVDLRAGKVLRTIHLGGPAKPSLARHGEALFHDARRSHNQWFSCHTCHVDGHTCGLTFDTLNDDSYGNPKLTPSLRGVSRTGPWTWHGWQKDLGASVVKSYTQTMFGPKPTPEEVRAVLAFLGTLDHPPNPNRGPDGKRSEAARRGQTLFEGKARCVRCHRGPDYTSEHNYDVKLEPDDSPYPRWNPPSLCGVFDRGPYLHDGRAGTLDEVLQGPHAPEKLGGAKLTPAERSDLIAFLNSL